jgi:hypothetical protein
MIKQEKSRVRISNKGGAEATNTMGLTLKKFLTCFLVAVFLSPIIIAEEGNSTKEDRTMAPINSRVMTIQQPSSSDSLLLSSSSS